MDATGPVVGPVYAMVAELLQLTPALTALGAFAAPTSPATAATAATTTALSTSFFTLPSSQWGERLSRAFAPGATSIGINLLVRAPEVVVVGAGVSGLSIALHLAERGVGPVRIYEREGVGAGQSGVQPGGVRLQWGTELNCRMALEAREFWREAEARLEPLVPFGWRPGGYLWLAHSEVVLARLTEGVALQNRLGIPSRSLEDRSSRTPSAARFEASWRPVRAIAASLSRRAATLSIRR